MLQFYQPLFLVIMFILSGAIQLFAEASVSDSLKQELQRLDKQATPGQVVDLYYQLGVTLAVKEEDYENSLQTFKQGFQIVEENELAQWYGDYLFQIADQSRRVNHYDEALEYLLRFIELPASSYHKIPKVKGFATMALVYQAVGDYQKAYEYDLQVLRENEAANDSVGIAKTLYGIGSILFYQENYSDALTYYQKSLALCQQMKDNKKMVYACLAACGSVYIETQKYDQALENNFKSLEIAKELQYKTGVAYALHNIGSTYVGMKNFKKAEEYFLGSLEIKKEVGDKWGMIGSYQYLGECNIGLGNQDKAIAFLDKALGLATAIGAKPRVSKIFQTFAEAYEKSGEPQKANYYLREYIALKDSLLNEETLREMGGTKSRYEVQKREDQIALLKTEKALLEKEKKIETLYYYLFAVGFISLLLFSIVWYSRFKMQKNLFGLLEEKSKEISLQNIKLEQSNVDLQQFAYVASHDLKEPLRMIASYTGLLKKRYNHLFDETGHEFMFYVVDAVGRMQNLLDDLLTYSRVETKAANHDWIEFADVLSMVTANLRLKLEEKEVEMIIDNDYLPRIKADRIQMVQLFQNLISNAIKFVEADHPIIQIGFQETAGKPALYVKDNGIGIDEKFKEKIFEMFHRLHARDQYEGTGIGLATCKRIVDRHQGEIWVESTPGMGSTFFIGLPAEAVAPSEISLQEALAL